MHMLRHWLRLVDTPFYRAIASECCRGVLMVMDSEVTPLSRAWCILGEICTSNHMRQPTHLHLHAVAEVHTVLQMQKAGTSRRPFFDVVSWIGEHSQQWWDDSTAEHWVEPGPALRLDLGNGGYADKVQPAYGRIPPTVALRGIQVHVKDTSATRQEDLSHILRMVAGVSEASREPPPDECPRYAEFDAQVHAKFYGPALHALAEQGQEAEVLRLLQLGGAEVAHYANPDGESPLFIAAARGHVRVVAMLVEAHADINKLKHDGCTALMVAAHLNNLAVVEALLAARADTRARDKWYGNKTALQYALNGGHIDVARLLLEHRRELGFAVIAKWCSKDHALQRAAALHSLLGHYIYGWLANIMEGRPVRSAGLQEASAMEVTGWWRNKGTLADIDSH